MAPPLVSLDRPRSPLVAIITEQFEGRSAAQESSRCELPGLHRNLQSCNVDGKPEALK